MKKISKIICAISLVLVSQMTSMMLMATNIDEATARQYGIYYLSVMTRSNEAELSQVTTAYTFMNEDLNIPAAYVFNVEKQGFVIVSGSDLWYPILGYSTEGLLDSNTMAPAFKWYIDGLCEYIRYSQNTDKVLIYDIEEEWDDLKYKKIPQAKNMKNSEWLLDSEWGQGNPQNPTYNKYCPYIEQDGVRLTAYVGCVATAMSQIMYYWKYPVHPADVTIGYECMVDSVYFDDIEIDMGEVSYDFDLMPTKLTSESTEEEINATALLCYHAGVSVEMRYGIAGSGARSMHVKNVLDKVFLYDENLRYLRRSIISSDGSEHETVSNDRWIEYMTEEIESGRPIYYSGSSLIGDGVDAGGHAFVCDGKDQNGKFHFNWGWNGQPNVWCDVRNNDLSVEDYNFRILQSMIFQIQPKSDGSESITDVEVNMEPAYPNPATTQITIPYRLADNMIKEMNVYSIDGKLMDKIILNVGAHCVQLDVSTYPNGVYFYNIGSRSCKFLVK